MAGSNRKSSVHAPRNLNAEAWCPTVSGRGWNLLQPTPLDVHWPDIAESLAKQARFNGHTPGYFYSVAQHSILVADQLPLDYQLIGLLHDAHEAYIGDITSPVKTALTALASGWAIQRLADLADEAIFEAAGLIWPIDTEAFEALKEADLRMLATERRDLVGPTDHPWSGPPAAPYPFRIKPWPWAEAMQRWTERLHTLLPAAADQADPANHGGEDPNPYRVD